MTTSSFGTKRVLPRHRTPVSVAQVRAFVRLGRPAFLANSTLLVVLGVTASAHGGFAIGWRGFLLALGFGWCTHLMTHYCNDYFDLDADRHNNATTGNTGGTGVLGAQLRPGVSLAAAFILLFADLALVDAMPSGPARMFGLLTIAVAWYYTAPPLRLNYRGLGEIGCAAAMEILLPSVTCYLQVGSVPTMLIPLLGILFLAQAARMSVMNLADRDGDQAAGKRTLAVLLGNHYAATFVSSQVALYVAVAGLTVTGALPRAVGLCLLATVALAIGASHLVRAVCRGERAKIRAMVVVASCQMSAVMFAATIGLALTTGAPAACWALVAGCVALSSGQTTTMVRRARRAGRTGVSMSAPSFDTENDERPIEELRAEIDRLDAEIIRALRERTALSGAVVRQRMADGGPRIVHGREIEIVRRYAALGSEGTTIARSVLRLGRGEDDRLAQVRQMADLRQRWDVYGQATAVPHDNGRSAP